jgi:uncharacterized protein
MKALVSLILIPFASALLHGQTSLKGTTWDGAIRISGIELNMIVTFHAPSDTPAATIDIPQQRAKGLPLINVSQKLPRVHFELQAGPGTAYFEGTLKADSITGIFVQAGQGGTFFLRPHAEPKADEPVPYKQEEVKFSNGPVSLAGTLTLPPTGKQHPAVVMITGSGPQNRDEEIFGFKPFKLIADALTRKGIAVLRYDDRGVGGSTGNMAESTTKDFAMDAMAGVRYLQSRKDIDSRKIGLCGHSEGAIAAPLAAAGSPDIAFLVLIAGPGIPGDTLVLWQLVTLARAGGMSERDIQDAVALQHRVFDAVRTDTGWQELRASMAELIGRNLGEMPAEQRAALGDSAQFVASATDSKIRVTQSPWFKFFTTYDPAATLEKVQCPVLALFGERDMQVPPGVCKEPLESALRKGNNKDITVHVIPGANHLFQAATTGNPSEYGSLKKEFVPGFLDTLTAWVVKHTGR